MLYRAAQCTWGIVQTLAGLVVFILYRKRRHYVFHGSIVTEWSYSGSVSLGMFVFVTEHPYFAERYKGVYTEKELSERLLVHEYGHTVQSLVLGPLYMPVIFLPSALWAGLPFFRRRRREKRLPYSAFFTEKWADRWGEKVTGKKALDELILS